MKENDHDQDPDDLDEEKLKALMNEKAPLKLGYKLGFILHPNFSVHILLTFIINLIVGGVVVGLYAAFYPIILVDTLIAFVIGMILYTTMEIIIKMLLIAFLWKLVIQTFGLLFFILNVGLFYIMDIMIEPIHFLYDASNIFVYTLSFMLVRLLFSTYVRRSRWIQGGR